MPDLKRAYTVMQAANAAYETNGSLRLPLLNAAGLVEIVYVIGAHDARALLCRDMATGLTILAAQGTQFTKGEIPSIWANLEVAPFYIGQGIDVHTGYYLQALSILKVLPSLSAVDIVGGHSMGGSLAHIIGVTEALPNLKAVLSFGAPKVGNAAFWKQARMNPERYVNERDAAPLWPLLPDEFEPAPGLQYWLHGTECTAVDHRPVMPDSIAQHFPDQYLAKLKALSSRA